MTATPDLTTPDLDAQEAGTPGGSVDAEHAREMVSQMADVAGAMFSLLLLQTSARAVHQDIPRGPVAEPPAPLTSPAPQPAVAAAPSFPLESVALVSIPLPAAEPQPVAEEDAAPVSIAMPTSLPMPEPADQAAPETPIAEAPTLAVATDVPRTMAMLSEIGFLDD